MRDIPSSYRKMTAVSLMSQMFLTDSNEILWRPSLAKKKFIQVCY